jgi:uncharacterized protein YciI
MYALAILRHRRPPEEVAKHTDAHRAYLNKLYEEGVVLASGPFDPRTGGAILLRVPDDDTHGALDRVRDNDPFTKAGVVNYELIAWNPMTGKDRLDRL